jgi:enamine deaminase RidA (YjgF/YER057c/UK114 family)
MELRRLERPSFVEFHLTSIAAEGLPPALAARLAWEPIAATLAAEGIVPFQERLHAPAGARREALEARGLALAARGLDAGSPCTFAADLPGPGRPAPVAVQLWGVAPRAGRDVSVTTVELAGGPRGRLLVAPGFRLLWLSSITGATGDGALAAAAAPQAERMFENAERALAGAGFEYRDVVRTWISVARILDWYGDLNRVRTAFHAARGIGTGARGASPLPASTGIQGRTGGEECVMDVLAFRAGDGGAAAARPVLGTTRQCEPSRYGSGFSRAVVLDVEGAATVLVSGTAAIGPDGASRHRGEPEAQLVETLLDIAALLEPLGGSLRDVCAGTLFYVDERAGRAASDVLRLLSLPQLPLVPVRADICRPELLVEIEAVAAIPRDRVKDDE